MTNMAHLYFRRGYAQIRTVMAPQQVVKVFHRMYARSRTHPRSVWLYCEVATGSPP